ncbi:unnamed protein product [Auanema sp. JU1783]|nr:unnamed protein product [Auanema sp. JU1783]
MSKSPERLTRFAKARQSFRQKAHTVGTLVEKNIRARKAPRWVVVLNKIYHDYGLKHIMLFSILVLYQFLGAGIFYMCEAEFDNEKEIIWNEKILENRTIFVNNIIPLMFNNTDYLFFLTQEQTEQVTNRLLNEMKKYERQLDIKYTDQKIPWDFWHSMLYAQTICTTIGYGHLYPSTVAGRVFTMIYAIFGIPLVLSILDDFGKVLTRGLNWPWWQVKRGCRRIFRYCTKQTMNEIRKLDEEDKKELDVFNLPIPVALLVVVCWIFICSATVLLWEDDWDYFVAFYFFFISLSTIGLGDITPTQPKYLLLIFLLILIGLSLVSMCINLIQAKLERTYQAGRSCDKKGMAYLEVCRRGSSLGIFRTSSSVHSISREAVQKMLANKSKGNKTCQTMLSFPSSTSNNSSIVRAVSHSRYRFLPRTLSIDDVMRMVDTEDGDILILADLVREESGLSKSSQCTTFSSDDTDCSRIVISKSFDSSFNPSILKQPTSSESDHNDNEDSFNGNRLPHSTACIQNLHEIEELEEIEDRIALGQPIDLASTVQFRSRLSLIPEQLPSMVEEVEEPSDESHPLSKSEENERTKRRPLQNMISYLSKRKEDRGSSRTLP